MLHHPYCHKVGLVNGCKVCLVKFTFCEHQQYYRCLFFKFVNSVSGRDCMDVIRSKAQLHPILGSDQSFRWTVQQANRNSPRFPLKLIQVHQSLGMDKSNGSSLPAMDSGAREAHGH